DIDYRSAPDFASIDPRQAAAPYHHFWMLGISATGRHGRKFFDQLTRADWRNRDVRDVYQAGPGCYLGGEPIFIPNPDDHAGGAVICQMFDPKRTMSAFGVFDAFNLARGPVAH